MYFRDRTDNARAKNCEFGLNKEKNNQPGRPVRSRYSLYKFKIL